MESFNADLNTYFKIAMVFHCLVTVPFFVLVIAGYVPAVKLRDDLLNLWMKVRWWTYYMPMMAFLVPTFLVVKALFALVIFAGREKQKHWVGKIDLPFVRVNEYVVDMVTNLVDTDINGPKWVREA
jgi:hypothetical protein